MSYVVLSFMLFISHSFLRVTIRSVVGMFEYMILVSKEANFMLWSYVITIRSFINWTVFFTLYTKGSGMCDVRFLTNIWASLYPGAFLQFVISLMGVSLCSSTRPLMVGAVGFKVTYFHFSLFCITL